MPSRSLSLMYQCGHWEKDNSYIDLANGTNKLWEVIFEAIPQACLTSIYMHTTQQISFLPVLSICFSFIMALIGLITGCTGLYKNGCTCKDSLLMVQVTECKL